MRSLTLIVLVFIIIACEKTEVIDASKIKDYIIMDPFEESIAVNDTIQDTVFYFFKENNKMTKIRFDYSLINEKVKLEKKDTVECKYEVIENHLFMALDEDGYVPRFGKESNEWEVLELNSDTLIVNRYFNGTKIAHYGFCVLEKK